jgi:alpha-L-fucosidase
LSAAGALPHAEGMMPDWFCDAKLGIFIHWGIYSAGDGGESWPFFRGEISHEDYMAQAKTFTAANYDPEAWARLFAEAGAKYAVLTAKHHDGFALWPTALSKLNSVEGSPAGRDLLGPYCAALRRHGLKVGIYYSHLDWSHPDYATILPKKDQAHDHGQLHANRFGYPQGAEDPAAWERFLDFHRGQLKELCTRYSPDLLWFDGDWERDPEQWRFQELAEQLREWAPGVVLNSRMGGYGDYATIIPEQAKVLQGLGRWTAKHAEAIYGTVTGLPHGHFYGASTLSKDRTMLYLICFDRPNGQVAVKGIHNDVKRVSIVGAEELSQKKIGGAPWARLPGVLWIDVPESALDPDATVLRVELEGPLELYRGHGDAVTFNV